MAKQTKANIIRAEKMDLMIYKYSGILVPSREEREAATTDILTDLRHYCDRHDVTFAELDRMSAIHYAAERK